MEAGPDTAEADCALRWIIHQVPAQNRITDEKMIG